MKEFDETAFCKKYSSALNAKKNYSKNRHDWYNQIFLNNKRKVGKPDGQPATKKTKTDTSPSASNFICHDCLGLISSIFQLQNDLALKTAECNEIANTIVSKEFEGALPKISFLEEQLYDFQQKHCCLQEDLLLSKKETKKYKSKYANMCATFSKRNSQDKNKDGQQIKYDNDIPDERDFLGKNVFSSKVFFIHQE